MSKKPSQHKIVQGTFGKMKEVKDFLPSPENLVLKETNKVKVTMSLDKQSVDFFKREANRLNSSYQLMIRNLLNDYVLKQNRLVVK